MALERNTNWSHYGESLDSSNSSRSVSFSAGANKLMIAFMSAPTSAPSYDGTQLTSAGGGWYYLLDADFPSTPGSYTFSWNNTSRDANSVATYNNVDQTTPLTDRVSRSKSHPSTDTFTITLSDVGDHVLARVYPGNSQGSAFDNGGETTMISQGVASWRIASITQRSYIFDTSGGVAAGVPYPDLVDTSFEGSLATSGGTGGTANYQWIVLNEGPEPSGGDYASTTTATSTCSGSLTTTTTKIRRLTAWASADDNDVITIPPGNNRVMIVIVVSEFLTDIGGETQSGVVGGLYYVDESKLANLGSTATLNLTGAGSPGVLIAFYENIDQTTLVEDSSSTPGDWSYTGLSTERVIIARAADLSGSSLTGDNPLYIHADVVRNGTDQFVAADEIATSGAWQEATTQATSGTVGFTGSQDIVNYVSFPQAITAPDDLVSTTTATSTVTSNLNVARDMIAAPSATTTVTPALDVQPVSFATTVAATSTLLANFKNTSKRYESTTTATSTVTSQGIIKNARFLASVSVTSVLGPTPDIAVLRGLVSTTTASAIVSASPTFDTIFQTAVAATSTVVGNLVATRPLQTTTAVTSAVTAQEWRDASVEFQATIAATTTVNAALSNSRPFIAAKTTYQSPGTGTQFTIPLPTHRAGQMLVVFLGHGDNNSPAWDTVGSTAGWRCERQGGNFAGTDVGGAWYFKLAESDSEVLVAENFSSEKFHAIAYAIDDADQYFIRSDNNGLTTSTQNPTFRPITFDKARTNLLSFTAVYGEADSIMTAAPTGYTIDETLQGGISFNDGSVSVATKEIASASSETPSTATMLNDAAHCSTTFIAYKRESDETTFQKRWNFNDSTSYFDTDLDDPRVIDNDWEAFAANNESGQIGWFTNQDGPSGSDWSDDAFWCLRAADGQAGTGYIVNETTFEQLGLNAGDAILGFDVSSIWYEIAYADVDTGLQGGTTTNGTVELVTPYETIELIPATPVYNGINPWTDISGSAVNLTTPILATDTVEFRVYMEITKPGPFTASSDIKFEDFELNAEVVSSAVLFASSVNATSAVAPGSFGFIETFQAATNVTSTVTSNLETGIYIAATATGIETNRVGTHAINMPTGYSVGQMLLVIFSNERWGGTSDARDAVAVIDESASTGGWTVVNQEYGAGGIVPGNGTSATTTILYKIAESTSETLTMKLIGFTTTPTLLPEQLAASSHVSYAVAGANYIDAYGNGQNVSDTSWFTDDIPPPPHVLPTNDYLSFVAIAMPNNFDGNQPEPTSIPAGWTLDQSLTNSRANLYTLTQLMENTSSRTFEEFPMTFYGLGSSLQVFVANDGGAGAQRIALTGTLPKWNGTNLVYDRTFTSNLGAQWIGAFEGAIDFFASGFDFGRPYNTSAHGLFRGAAYDNTGVLVDNSGYVEWTTTLEELGCKEGTTITDITSASVMYGWRGASSWNAAWSSNSGLKDTTTGSGSHLELIHDGNSYSLIPDQPNITSVAPTQTRLRLDVSPGLTGLSIPSDDPITLRQHLTIKAQDNNPGGASVSTIIEIGPADFDVAYTVNRFFATSIAATSTVTPALDRNPVFASAIDSTVIVTSNIDETRKLMSASAVTSILGPTPSMVVDRPLVSTTVASLTLAPLLVRDFDFAVDPIVVTSTVNPNQFFFGLEVALTAASTVTATLDRQPKFSTTIAATSAVTAQEWRDISREFSASISATSAVDQTAIERQVNWSSTTSVASAVFPSTVLVDRPFRTILNGFCVAVGIMDLKGVFRVQVFANSTATASLDRVRGIQSTTNVVSDVGGNIVEGLRFISTSVVQSAVILPTRLQIVRNMIAEVTGTSLLTVQRFDRAIDFDTAIALASTVGAVLVVITNTLELTWSQTYFLEVAERELQLVTESFDDIAIINELDELTVNFVETGADVIITDTTDN